MKTNRYLLLVAVILLSGCAAAPMAAMYGTSAANALYQGAILKGMFGDSERERQNQDAIVLYRDGEYTKKVVKKAFKNLDIPVANNGDGVVRGITKDGINVEVKITEKTSKMTHVQVNTSKGLIGNDPLMSRMVADEIKKLAGIKS